MLRFTKYRRPYGVQVPLTSLIDVVFLLLIYFLLTTNFITDEGIKVNLPRATAVTDSINTEITVLIDQSGSIYLNQQRTTIPDLLDQFRTRLAEGNNPVIIVKADKSIIVDKVVEVMDIAKAAGANRMLLATERSF